MKIVYFQIIFKETSGIYKKIFFQISALLKLHINVKLVLSGNSLIDKIRTQDISITYNKINLQSEWNLLRKILYCRKFAHFIDQEISDLNEDDILYLRYPYPIFYYPITILKRFRRCKIVFEHNTIEYKEFLLEHQYGFLLSELLFGKILLKQSDAIVGVTSEITSYELSRTGNLKKPHITIGNGFDVESVPVKKFKALDDTELHLLCVANVSKWHGLDRLLKGMAAYKGNSRIVFHIAGEGSDILNLQKMVDHLNLQRSVVFHGFLTGKKLDDLFDSCHFAVGSLGIHRIGLKEASILKAREYCSRGIPFVSGYMDPDFPDDFEFIYRVPSDESDINIQDMIDFIAKIHQKSDYSQKMRLYATDNLDWSIKMKQLSVFFKSIVKNT